MFLITIISQVLGQTMIPVNIVDAKPRTEPRTSATVRGVDECQGTLRWEREDFKGAVRWDREESKGTLSATAVKAYIEGMDDFEDSDDDEAVSVTDEEEGASSFSGVLVRDETQMLRAKSEEGADAIKNALHSMHPSPWGRMHPPPHATHASSSSCNALRSLYPSPWGPPQQSLSHALEKQQVAPPPSTQTRSVKDEGVEVFAHELDTHELDDACKDDALSSACTPETMILSYTPGAVPKLSLGQEERHSLGHMPSAGTRRQLHLGVFVCLCGCVRVHTHTHTHSAHTHIHTHTYTHTHIGDAGLRYITHSCALRDNGKVTASGQDEADEEEEEDIMAKTLSYIFPYLSHPKNVSVNAKVGDRVSCGVEPVFECLVLFLVALLVVVSVLWGGGEQCFCRSL